MTARKIPPSECSDEVALVVCELVYELHGYEYACVVAEAYAVPLHWFLDESDIWRSIE